MRTISAHVLSAVVLVLSGAGAGARALDIHEELQMGWKMGLLPRQATQNLQTFTGNLGGVAASARTMEVRWQRGFGGFAWREFGFRIRIRISIGRRMEGFFD
ncbi:hypothetical protein COL154_000441 [Colletotrichum chrysophilum]|nr:hypothetical protein COL154_000441 [Colletotrichum chrysophilum]